MTSALCSSVVKRTGTSVQSRYKKNVKNINVTEPG